MKKGVVSTNMLTKRMWYIAYVSILEHYSIPEIKLLVMNEESSI